MGININSHRSHNNLSETVDYRHHKRDGDWLETPTGEPRGYIQPQSLKELWFHTGTRCNLGCSFCLEGSGPRVDRIEMLRCEDVVPFLDEAVTLGVEQFSFTGGEPFVNEEMIEMLKEALGRRPCLVLTNGTGPFDRRFEEIARLIELPNKLKFRVSLDHADPKKHDAIRGRGNFAAALKNLARAHATGFHVSVARHSTIGENKAEVEQQYVDHFTNAGLPSNTTIVAFPQLYRPGDSVDVPGITENCMTTYKDEISRAQFMCNYSKMIVRKNGQTCVYACTLVDDDDSYDFGSTLSESMDVRVMLRHHRCYSCFSAGTSCSETSPATD